VSFPNNVLTPITASLSYGRTTSNIKIITEQDTIPPNTSKELKHGLFGLKKALAICDGHGKITVMDPTKSPSQRFDEAKKTLDKLKTETSMDDETYRTRLNTLVERFVNGSFD